MAGARVWEKAQPLESGEKVVVGMDSESAVNESLVKISASGNT
jgi:hypothetical protein